MTDSKIPDLTTQLTTRALLDLLVLEHDPSGTPETVKMTAKDFLREVATELTISSDAITLTQLNHKLQPQSGTSDDLSTINGTTAGQSGVLYASDFGTDTITIKHNVGNILCMGAADITLSYGCVFWYSNGTKVFISGGGGGGGGGSWGSISGTLSSQTDLWNILSTGWVNVSETWTYASASTFTVSGDLTSRFTKGTRLKLTQTTVKYFVVVNSSYSAPNTTVTVAVNTSYTIANAAITSPCYSYDLSPAGYPDYYSFTPTWTNVTTGNGTIIARYSVHGRRVRGQISFVLGTTSSISGQITVDCPVTALADYDYQAIGAVGMIDTGVALYMGEAVLRTTSKIEVRAINASGTYSVWSATSGTVPHTWGSTDQLTIEFDYNI